MDKTAGKTFFSLAIIFLLTIPSVHAQTSIVLDDVPIDRSGTYLGNPDIPSTLNRKLSLLGEKDFLNVRWKSRYSDGSDANIIVNCYLNCDGANCPSYEKCSYNGPTGDYSCTVLFGGNTVYKNTINKVKCEFSSIGGQPPLERYRKPVTVSNSGSALTGYQISVTLTDTPSLIQAGKMRSDCGDIRFTDSDGGSLLSYWLESGCNSPSTRLWVKVPSIPTGSKTVYVYYGDLSLTGLSNGDSTFDFFDDFEDNSLNSNKWTVRKLSSYSETGGKWTVSSPDPNTWSDLKTGIYATSGPSGDFISTVNLMEWTAQQSDLGENYLTFLDPADNIVSFVGMTDAWASSNGQRTAGYCSSSAGTGANSEPASGSAKLEIIKSGSTYTMRYNGNQIVSGACTRTIGKIVLTTTRFQTYNPKLTKFSDVTVRKYSSPEPTVSIGAEELQSGSGTTTKSERDFKTIDFTPTVPLKAYTVGETGDYSIQIKNLGLLNSKFTTNVSSPLKGYLIFVNNPEQTSANATYGETAATFQSITFLAAEKIPMKVNIRATSDPTICSTNQDCQYLDSKNFFGSCESDSVKKVCWQRTDPEIVVGLSSLPEYGLYGTLLIIFVATFLLFTDTKLKILKR